MVAVNLFNGIRTVFDEEQTIVSRANGNNQQPREVEYPNETFHAQLDSALLFLNNTTLFESQSADPSEENVVGKLSAFFQSRMREKTASCEQDKLIRRRLRARIEKFGTAAHKESLCDNLIECSLGIFARSREHSWQLCENERKYFFSALQVIEKFASEQQRAVMAQISIDIFKEILMYLQRTDYQLEPEHFRTMQFCLTPIYRIGAVKHFKAVCQLLYPAVISLPSEHDNRGLLIQLFNGFIDMGEKQERFQSYINSQKRNSPTIRRNI